MTPSTGKSLRDYLDTHGVELLPCHAGEPGRPSVELPVPRGWTIVPAHLFPRARTVLVAPEYTEAGWTPIAVLLHNRLSVRRPTGELLAAAAAATQELPEWSELDCETSNFRGHPSVITRGKYRAGGVDFDARSRHLVIDHDQDRYLTQLAVTTRADAPASLREGAQTIHTEMWVDPARAS
ncbi:LpqN/LpqT family lipoprotein [Rhodococcus sp. CH91]|uniref:LpqN/LpqT family lipoprotein n=1 Tax=Rhodococcus sp. CH91 TaxID=2910256 RepID=UPI001F4A1A9F|nr:LpqN/LpqT family lipoprotein [Rhodococcus sp. CH91]